MVETLHVKPLEKAFLESIGFWWHTDPDDTAYLTDTLVCVSEAEAQAYYDAVNTLYEMMSEAAQYVIDHALFHELGIPFNLVNTIKRSWENDVHWHTYGRFDLSGGVGGAPIKLIEFNADTPTALYETAIVQWAHLKYNGFDEAAQFNTLYEALKENFKRLVVLGGDTAEFGKYYEGWKILFSCVGESIEDEVTTKLLQTAAKEAGFHTDFAFIDAVGFNDEEGIFKGDEAFEYWFKLIPWENIALDEGDLALSLEAIITNQKAIILNPAYTLLFQSKGIMKILWDLFPNHPLLLETSFEPLSAKQVKKPMFGREGANVEILDAQGARLEGKEGIYGHHPVIFQAYEPFAKDAQGHCYQAGVFFAYEGCGLGFRRGGEILDNYSKFVGHMIKEKA
ncbi:MAG: glutathionylspermidine synthase family protein [Campylobacterales bacterium]|nr:glutathionylspermidine synthase family protein [Campylobacterales bacterium]